MPLAVTTPATPAPPMGKELVPGVNTAIETKWQQQQIKLATLVPGGRRIVATKSGHMIPAEQPALVIEAIEDMLQQIGTRSPRPEARVGAAGALVAGPSGEEGFAQRLDEDRWLAAFEVPGVAVALVRDGQLTWFKGYGQADLARGAAVTPDTVFQVGSISKPLTAWGVMRIVEQGKLD